VVANKSRICLSTSRLRCSPAIHGCRYFSLPLGHKRRTKDELIVCDTWSPRRLPCSTTRGVEVVPLGDVNPGVVAEQTSTFLAALTQVHDPAATQSIRTRAEAILGGVLGWMWDQITGPVLNHLGHTTTPPEGALWPRVWWCPSGALSLLPIHAAGHHDLAAGASDAVIDRVISSSIPTVHALLRALLHARQIPPLAAEPRVLVVAMSHTAGMLEMPGADLEALALEDLLTGRVDVLGPPGRTPATYDTVTAALRHHAWVHLCCQTESDPTYPSASRLMLADKPLSLTDLSAVHIENAELAFLSSSTTAGRSVTLLDEPIHLAAACQLAGYRHVVAALWPIADADAVAVTKGFYTHLTTSAKTTDPAAALHDATRRLRAICPTHPSRWAPYTHTGP
jgi:CHAT domain